MIIVIDTKAKKGDLQLIPNEKVTPQDLLIAFDVVHNIGIKLREITQNQNQAVDIEFNKMMKNFNNNHDQNSEQE